MSSLSSRSIRNKSSSILSSTTINSHHHPSHGHSLTTSNPTTTTTTHHHHPPTILSIDHTQTNYSKAHHPSISTTATSQRSNYARSINEDESMVWQIDHPPSSNNINPTHPSSSTTTTTTNNNNNNNNTTTTTTNTTTTTTPPNNNPSSHNTPSTPNTVESLLNLAHKRITTLVYLKKVHEGKIHWFNTILLSRSELERWFEPTRMLNRTTKFAVLGMSLSALLDINNVQDFLKAMINLLHEFESIPNDNMFRPRMSSLSRGIFKQSSKTGRKSAGGNDYSITLQDSGDPSLLYTPNIPFDLDYFEVWITLSDILVEVYQKIISFITLPNGTAATSLGLHHHHNPTTPATTTTTNHPNTFNPPPNTHHHHPNHHSATQPTSTTTTTTTATTTTTTSSSSATSSAHNTPLINNISVPIPPTRSSSVYSIVGLQPSIAFNAHHLESITRIDSKLKKLIVILTKELDGMARTAIRDELALLDPMLLNSNSSSSSSFHLTTTRLNQNLDWE